jgi:hypothetical protein
VYQPLLLSSDYVGGYGKYIKNYRQSSRLYGGWWQASWDMNDYSDPIKQLFFNRRIGSHVDIYDGGSHIWSGLIWEMELYSRGVLRRISMDKVRNAVKCIYTKQDDDTRLDTGYYTNDESIARYGRIEEAVYLDRTYTDTAQKYAQTILQEQQWPLPRVVSVREPKVDEVMQLRIKCVGYTHTLNYQYVTIADAGLYIGGAIGAIKTAIDTDSEFLEPGSMATNETWVRPSKTETRLLDWINELTDIGDGSTPYIYQAYRNRKLSYLALSNEPTIFWDGKEIRSSLSRSSKTQKYYVKPGIYRDLTWTSATLDSNAFLQDKRDSIVSEVEAGMNYSIPILKADDYNDSDLMASLLQAQIDFHDWEEEQ